MYMLQAASVRWGLKGAIPVRFSEVMRHNGMHHESSAAEIPTVQNSRYSRCIKRVCHFLCEVEPRDLNVAAIYSHAGFWRLPVFSLMLSKLLCQLFEMDSVLGLRFSQNGIAAVHMTQTQLLEHEEGAKMQVSSMQFLSGFIAAQRAGPALATMLKPIGDLLQNGDVGLVSGQYTFVILIQLSEYQIWSTCQASEPDPDNYWSAIVNWYCCCPTCAPGPAEQSC